MIKTFAATTLLLATVTATSTSYAQTNQQNDGGIGGIVASIVNFNTDFDTKYGEIYTPSTLSNKSSSIMYPQYLSEIQSANTNSADTRASNNAIEATSVNISNSLTRFIFELQKPPKSSTPDPLGVKTYALVQTQPKKYEQISYEQYNEENKLSNLINGNNGVASDTLYMSDTQINDAKNVSGIRSTIKKPSNTQQNDNNFNFAALFEPTAYSLKTGNNGQEQTNSTLQAAKNYIVYAAQSTKNLADGLDLASLKTDPHALASFKTDKNYLSFAMTIRTLVAIRSITIDTLEYLIAERTPHKDWGKAIGNPNQDGTASPLQVEAYQANHRIQDPNWYKSIMTDAPITLQRTIAIELAEIEHQNYQAHLDRERILAALTASNLQTNSTASTGLQVQISTLNKDIQNLLPAKKPLTPSSSNNASEPTFTAGTGTSTQTPTGTSQ